MNRTMLALALSLTTALPAAGQESGSPPASSPEAVAPSAPAPRPGSACDTARISHVFIDNHSIFDTTDPELDSRLRWAYDIANTVHVRTRREVIRRELLFRAGDCLEPLLLEESERLLRALNFLSRVDIYSVRQPDGTYHVIVDTQDEWSTQVDLRVGWDGGPEFEGVALRETNLLGSGRAVELFYFERDATRDYGVAYRTVQLGGTRWDLDAAAGRTRPGNFLRAAVTHPFVGEIGRWAARQGVSHRDRFFDYTTGGTGDAERHVLLPVLDRSVDVAAVARLGRPGRMTLVGGALAFHGLAYSGGRGGLRVVRGENYDEGDPAPDPVAGAIAPQMNELNTVRLLFLLGRRRIGWVQRRGLDTMHGQQDIPLGTELSVAAGRSLPLFGTDDDLFGTISFYGAAEAGRVLVGARARADARHRLAAEPDAPTLEDIFSNAQVLAYWRPAALPAHTLFLRAAGTAGWDTRTPFQLTLGGDRSVRGFDDERFPGGRRAVFSLEDRIRFGGPFPDLFDLGATAFLDLGRVWPGDVPFGRDSGWRATAGLGLRAAFPAGGRTTYRIDLALPLDDGAGWHDVRLIVSAGELLGFATAFDDPQLHRSRRHTVTSRLFHFP